MQGNVLHCTFSLGASLAASTNFTDEHNDTVVDLIRDWIEQRHIAQWRKLEDRLKLTLEEEGFESFWDRKAESDSVIKALHLKEYKDDLKDDLS